MRQFKPNTNATALVIGDLILDRYIHGNTSRISPEAPVPVVHVQNVEERPGGAANVALNIQKLGVPTKIVGVTGDDSESRQLETMLEQEDIECHFSRLSDYPTVSKLRVVSQHQQLLRLDFEGEADLVDIETLKTSYLQQISGCDVVIFSDYAKGALQDIESFIKLAKEQGVFTLVDPKGNDFDRYRNADLITPNLKEFESIAGRSGSQLALIEKAINLRAELGLTAILITQGEHGMTLIDENETATHLEAEALEVFDVTGAGDTVIATFSAATASGYKLADAMYFANKAAGRAVARLGAVSVSEQELNEILNPTQTSKEPGLQDLKLELTKRKENGEKVVMTNGCFDIIHAGHVHCLKEAKALGDVLVVAVNEDDSVSALKGKSRPLNSCNDRVAVLAALDSVDYIIRFNESTPEQLIKTLVPDILVKGGDYQITEIAGADFVIAQGGRVELIQLKEGKSTSNLIDKIQSQEESA